MTHASVFTRLRAVVVSATSDNVSLDGETAVVHVSPVALLFLFYHLTFEPNQVHALHLLGCCPSLFFSDVSSVLVLEIFTDFELCWILFHGIFTMNFGRPIIF